MCTKTSSGYLLPAAVVNAYTCYEYSPSSTANCQDLASKAPVTESGAQVNKTGAYPGGFYWFMGFFAGSNVSVSVYAMRFVTILIAAIALLATLAVAPPNLRQAGAIGVVAALGPLGWFLLASTNPSSWAIIGVGLYWVALLSHALNENQYRRWGAFGLGLVLGVLACAARGDAGGYLIALNLCAAIALVGFRIDRSRWRSTLGLMIATSAIAVFVLLQASQVGAISSGATSSGSGFGIDQFLYNVLNVFTLSFGSLGYSPLGWLDTGMPIIIPVALSILVVRLIVAGNRSVTRGARCAALIVLVLLFLVPMAGLYQYQTVVPFDVQSRYVMPLLPAFIGFWFIRLNQHEQAVLTRGMRWFFLLAVFLSFSIALLWNTIRYTQGLPPGVATFGITTGAPSFDVSGAAKWWPTTAFSPGANWIVGSLAAGAVLLLAAPYFLPRRTIDPTHAPE